MKTEKRIRSFEDLIVWQMGIAIVKEIYLVTSAGLLKNDFGLKDQMRRASVSIPTNIAEGFERTSRREYLQFLNFAKGSAGELRSLLRVALEIEYLAQPLFNNLSNSAARLSASLSNQISAIKTAPYK